VSRFAIAALVVAFANVADADAPKSAPEKEPTPDEIADVESREANLESQEPRSGLTFGVAFGGSIKGGDGVATGGALSLRLGHVATRKTIITFELAGTGSQHKASLMGETLTDTNFGLFAGAQRYVKRSVWLRLAGGVTTLVKNIGSDSTGDSAIGGIAGLGGVGADLARWGYKVFGLESFGILSASRDGVKVQGALCLSFAWY
jgi:hypothetical protein